MSRLVVLAVLMLALFFLTSCKTIDFNGKADYEGYIQLIHPDKEQIIVYVRDNLNEEQRRTFSYNSDSFVVMNVTQILPSTRLLNHQREAIDYENLQVGDKVKIWVRNDYEEKKIKLMEIFAADDWMDVMTSEDALIIQQQSEN